MTDAVPSALAFALGSSEPDTAARDLIADLRRRGHRILSTDGRLFLSNASQLTPDDRAAIKQHHAELLCVAEVYAQPSIPIRIEIPISQATSLAQFLGTIPESKPTWQAQEPPSLTGIHDIVLNFETNGLDWAHGHRPVGVTVGTLDGQMRRYLPFAHQRGGNLDEAVVKEWARRELHGKHITNINTRFDVHMGREWGVDLEAQGNTVSDVAHYAALLDDYRKKFALDILAKDYLGGVEIARIDESNMADYPAWEVAPRAEYQALLVAQLREKMWPLLDAEDLQRVRQLEDDVIYPVCEMEKNAAPLDRAMLKQWSAETERIQLECLREVANEARFMVNPDSPSDWQKLFAHFGLRNTEYTDTVCRSCKETWNTSEPVAYCTKCQSTDVRLGVPSFTDKILKGIDNRFIQLARRAGKLASLRSKFLVAYDEVVGDDSLLRYSLHQMRVDEKGTVRGRFSSSDKNIQQVMNKDTHMESFGSEEFFVRRLFIPKTGEFLSADASQIEFRLFVHRSESKRLIDAYVKDPDISFHRVAESIIKPFKSDLPYTKIKSMNFLFVYGGGKAHAAEFLELPRDVADKFCDIYHQAFPEVKKLGRKTQERAERDGFITSLLGRRARFPDKKFAYKALNADLQPSAADIFKTKTVELHRERKHTGFVMRAPVHDEMIGDAQEPETAARVREILNVQTFKLSVPILWSVNTGRNWAECK